MSRLPRPRWLNQLGGATKSIVRTFLNTIATQFVVAANRSGVDRRSVPLTASLVVFNSPTLVVDVDDQRRRRA